MPSEPGPCTGQVILREDTYNVDTGAYIVSVYGTFPEPQNPVVVHVKSPFSSQEEERDLHWYCESADRELFTVSPRLERVEADIELYGITLFRMVFSTPGTTLPDGQVTIRVVGSARFCALHWELMTDPDRGPVCLDLQRELVRDVPEERVMPQHRLARYPTLNVLFLTARRRGEEMDIPLRIESLAVMESVRDNDLPVRIDVVRPGTRDAMIAKLWKERPGFYHVLHLDCHGAGGDVGQDDDKVLFENEISGNDIMSADEIADIVDGFGIPIVVTSACRSGMIHSTRPSFAYRLFQSSHVQCVLAMALSVLVDTTARFVREFYRSIAQSGGRSSVRAATRSARRKMHADKYRVGVTGKIRRADWWIPQLFERMGNAGEEGGVFERCSWDEAVEKAASQEEKRRIWEHNRTNVIRRKLLKEEPVDERTFLGRNEDLKLLEHKVFSHSRCDNIVLLHGAMGVGKSAFLTYVSWWWCVTGSVRDKFVFRLHEKLNSLDGMIWHIYRQVFNVQNYDYTNASKAQKAENRRRVTQHLTTHRYVVVIDSAERLCTKETKWQESFTNGYDAGVNHSENELDSDGDDEKALIRIEHKKDKRREEIAKWLCDLQDGQTIVLVGFRGSSECQLMRYIQHKSNGMDLATIVSKYPSKRIGNLSKKWSKALVKQILNEHGVTCHDKYKQLYSYYMLDLYGGNPLVINLMLSNVDLGSDGQGPAHHPEELYDKLHQYLALPSSANIVKRSLEGSFNFLSDSQKEAILFLAPFKGSVTQEALTYYADALEKHEFKSTKFNRQAWDSAIKVAVRWGLLTYHERMRPRPGEQAWRIHAYLSLLLMKKMSHRTSTFGNGTVNDLLCGPGYLSWDHIEKDDMLKPMVRAMHSAYWKLSGKLYDDLRSSDKSRNDIGRVSTEIEFWNLKKVLQFALEEKKPFYGILLPMYWYLAVKNDITQRYELCRRVVERIGTYDRFADIPAEDPIYRKDVPRAYHIYGVLLGCSRVDKLREAETWFLRALRIWDSYAFDREVAVTEHELGWVAMNRRDYPKAKKHYEKALKMNGPLGRAQTYHSLGLLEANVGNFKEALQYHEKAQELYKKNGDARAVASTFHHMAIAAAKLNDFVEADKCAKATSTSRKRRQEVELQGNAYQLRGNIAQRRARKEGTSFDERAFFLKKAKRKYDKAMVAYNNDNGHHYGVIPERELLHENYGLLMATQRHFTTIESEKFECRQTEMASYMRISDGKYPKALYNLGLLHEHLGEQKQAYDCYSKAAKHMTFFLKDSIEWEACRRANMAKAQCLVDGIGVEKDEHEAIRIVLQDRGQIGAGDPLLCIGLPID